MDKVLCDEAIVLFVEEDSIDRLDQHAYRCWAFCKDPSRLSQVVFLSLSDFERGSNQSAQIHVVRPRGFMHSHVFKVLIHIDVVEDLAFYHFPQEELLADGKVPWKEFAWKSGVPNGELDEEDLHPPPSRYYHIETPLRRHPRDDEEGDRN
jgi:hypothetical protein